MKRVLFFLVIFVVLLGACAPAATPVPALAPTTAPTQASISLKDGLGRAVTLKTAAKKIVSLAPSNTEILFAVGAGAAVIARDEFADYPPEAKALPSIGGSMGKYNFEQIASLQPDLVLASQLNTPEQIKTLEDLKLTVFVLSNPTNMDGMYANLATVAKLTGKEAATQTLIDGLKKRVQSVTDTIAKSKDRPKVFYELDASDPAKPYTAGANTFIDILINLAGGTNVGAALKGDYPMVSQEELVTQDPAIILLGDAAFGTTPEQVAKRAGWASIKAVKDNKVFGVDDNLFSRPGARLVDGLETLAKLLHPELFK
jgi:iron complex transport system substrate-binding protein